MECYFFVEILAPSGLRGIEASIDQCQLPLYPWTSGYNGQIILRCRASKTVDWNMDPSNAAELHASGCIEGTVDQAIDLLQSLSNCLTDARFPHRITIDDADGEMHTQLQHLWPIEPQS